MQDLDLELEVKPIVTDYGLFALLKVMAYVLW